MSLPCAQMMKMCNALEKPHVELEEIPLVQYRARDEFPLMKQWPRGRADDRVTLPADLGMMDLHTMATSQPTLRAVEKGSGMILRISSVPSVLS